MDYQVWIKDEFGDTYSKVDCGDLGAAKREVEAAVRKGGAPILTVEVPYSLVIKVEDVGTEKPKRRVETKQTEETEKEAAKSEADQSETGADQSTGAES